MRLFKSIFFCLMGMIALFKIAAADVTVGEKAPDFELTDTYGNVHRLSDYKGQYVILEWINHDCPFVQKHYNSGNMQSLQDEMKTRDIVWLSINSSAEGQQGNYPPEEANQLTESKGANPTAVLLDPDGSVGLAYGAKTTPHMFVIDGEGTLIYQGAIDSIPSVDLNDIPEAVNYVRQAVNESMSGQEVAVPSTKSYGCSVKYKIS